MRIYIVVLIIVTFLQEILVSTAKDVDLAEKILGRSLESLLNGPSGLLENVNKSNSLIIKNGRAVNKPQEIFDVVLQDVQTVLAIFNNFKNIFEKEKNDTKAEENEKRISIFKKNLKNILVHNSRAGKSFTYDKGVNLFTDMTEEEVIKHYTGFLPAPKDSLGRSMGGAAIQNDLENLTPPKLNRRGRRTGRWWGQWGGGILSGGGNWGNLAYTTPKPQPIIPTTVDWRSYGAVSPVKNQQSCGSCTLFASSSLLESAMYIWKGGPLLDLSEQELLDCIPEGNGIFGCDGNWYDAVLKYLNSTGQGSDKDYPSPYQNEKEDTCKKGAPVAKLSNFYRLPNSEAILKRYVGLFGPVAVSMHINSDIIGYSSGIYQGNCTGDINHSVLIVGYGNDRGIPYWLIKNSWSTAWGEQGYFRIRRHFNNLCQIASYAFMGTA